MTKRPHKTSISITRIQISEEVSSFAIKAARCHCGLFDIIIEDNRLQWESHAQREHHTDTICTYKTKEVLGQQSLFEATLNIAKIEAAISEHNNALET